MSLPFALRQGGQQSYAPISVQTKLASKLHSLNVNYGLDPTRALINQPTGNERTFISVCVPEAHLQLANSPGQLDVMVWTLPLVVA